MIPRSVTLNKNKRSIQIEYDNDKFLLLTSSYLRACSPSAENKNQLRKKNSQDNKQKFKSILITKIESVGNYAIRIIFNDGHSTGIYSWDYLMTIGAKSQDF
tara:strand:+ start:329 stop:634 length:306 start_codon:yes stop_codon:yes gene_type:complete